MVFDSTIGKFSFFFDEAINDVTRTNMIAEFLYGELSEKEINETVKSHGFTCSITETIGYFNVQISARQLILG